MAKDDLLKNLDLVFDNLNDGLLLVDLKGKILKINKALLKLGGYKAEELVGKNVMKLIKIFPPSSLKKIATSFIDAAKGVPGDRYELEAKTNKGEPRVIEVSNSLIQKNGKKLGAVVTVRDITDRISYAKQLEEAKKGLKKNEEKYRQLFENSRDAIMTLEPPTWKFTSANPATIELFKAKNEKEFESLGPGDVSPKYQPDKQLSSKEAKKFIRKAMIKGSAFFEWTHKKLTGEEFSASVLLTRMEFRGKKFLQATVREITDQKRAEEKLKSKMEELEKVNQLMVGRELKMVELKKEIKNLKSGMVK